MDEKMQMEIEEKGMSKEEAPLHFDAAKLGGERIQVRYFDDDMSAIIGDQSYRDDLFQSGRSNSVVVASMISITLNGIMEALTCCDINTIGVCRPHSAENADLLERDLDKVGIPFGADHTGCKLLLTSASEEVLSNRMLAQKVFKF